VIILVQKGIEKMSEHTHTQDSKDPCTPYSEQNKTTSPYSDQNNNNIDTPFATKSESGMTHKENNTTTNATINTPLEMISQNEVPVQTVKDVLKKKPADDLTSFREFTDEDAPNSEE
jgi:hypothetical protein